MSIYTKKGDLGETSNFDGKRKAKTDNLFWLLGALDELNARIGVTIAETPKGSFIINYLEQIQNDIFELSSIVATEKPQDQDWIVKRVGELEGQIDKWDSELTPLRNFVLSGIDSVSANLHLCRVATRTAERYFFVTFNKSHPLIAKYLNRLSDYIFQLTRYHLKQSKLNERIWRPKIKP
ncbi:cob(I)yrinic acid a,c-diamide adenosyltransferase [Candidatus Berkelbacteria bacterium]|nr:cob(I)yrinic acid a,c-diamide adenosyltransferase [Candidatus Berkelbacteria bacterium]